MEPFSACGAVLRRADVASRPARLASKSARVKVVSIVAVVRPIRKHTSPVFFSLRILDNSKVILWIRVDGTVLYLKFLGNIAVFNGGLASKTVEGGKIAVDAFRAEDVSLNVLAF